MEKLVQQLIDKHNLKKSEAIDAIRMVANYLKQENPVFDKLIDNVIEEKLRHAKNRGKNG